MTTGLKVKQNLRERSQSGPEVRRERSQSGPEVRKERSQSGPEVRSVRRAAIASSLYPQAYCTTAETAQSL